MVMVLLSQAGLHLGDSRSDFQDVDPENENLRGVCRSGVAKPARVPLRAGITN